MALTGRPRTYTPDRPATLAERQARWRARRRAAQARRRRPVSRPARARPEETPPPPAVTQLAARLAEAWLAPLRRMEALWPAPTPEAVLTTLVAALLTDPCTLAQTDWPAVRRALPLAVDQLRDATDAAIYALDDWRIALDVATLTLDDPSTLVAILEQLTAQRYQHPPATARAVGAAIASLETYLAVHAPTSTAHPARHAVEL
jgi:hypothetical protein